MNTFENQKTIVNNTTITGRFYQVDETTFTLGCKELKPTTFLVWQAINLQYFTDKELGLSTSQICKLMDNIRKPTVQSAINELIEKGWMVCLGGNHYELVSPRNEKRDTPRNEKRDTPCNEKRDTPEEQPELVVPTNRNCEFLPIGTDSSVNRNCEFLENRLDIVDSIDSENETNTASSIDNAASEDAEASSGMSEQELRNYFKSQGNIRKVFVKDTLTPWLKYEDGYRSNLTCLELWCRVKDNYEDLGKGSLKCDHQSLAATYTLWNRAIVAKDKD